MAADPTAVAQQFVDYYYKMFDSDRKQLAPLYRDHSMLTFETSQLQGTQAIVDKLANLPFEKVQHAISTLDAQPSATDKASILVLVTGKLITGGDEQNPLSFSQAFQLVPEGGSYYIFNDVFRLVYG